MVAKLSHLAGSTSHHGPRGSASGLAQLEKMAVVPSSYLHSTSSGVSDSCAAPSAILLNSCQAVCLGKLPTQCAAHLKGPRDGIIAGGA